MNDLTNVRQSPWSEWPLDREIVITRVVDAPRTLVFEAWTDPAQLPVSTQAGDKGSSDSAVLPQGSSAPTVTKPADSGPK